MGLVTDSGPLALVASVILILGMWVVQRRGTRPDELKAVQERTSWLIERMDGEIKAAQDTVEQLQAALAEHDAHEAAQDEKVQRLTADLHSTVGQLQDTLEIVAAYRRFTLALLTWAENGAPPPPPDASWRVAADMDKYRSAGTAPIKKIEGGKA